MSAVGLAVVCAVAIFAASAVSLALIRIGHRHEPALDSTWSGPQKIHLVPVPRIGGIAIAAGLLVAAIGATLFRGSAPHLWLLLVCVTPGFAWGLVEDMSKSGHVFARLAITGCTAMLAFVLLDARIVELRVPLLDDLLVFPAFSFAMTLLAVTGVGHAMNVIDGLNGLAGVVGLLASIGLAIVAWTVGDQLVMATACFLGASILGFLLFNYPRGHIFLGDGGAYLIGLVLAVLSVILVHRNPEVSPWFPLVLLAYPIWETLFSMYRRRLRRTSTGKADALHLHSLVYRRVVRWTDSLGPAAHCMERNYTASLILWTLPSLCLVAAVLLWNRTLALQAGALGFAALYIFVYRRIVRFGLPRRAVLRLEPPVALAKAEAAE